VASKILADIADDFLRFCAVIPAQMGCILGVHLNATDTAYLCQDISATACNLSHVLRAEIKLQVGECACCGRSNGVKQVTA
jgi:hypothetical protein